MKIIIRKLGAPIFQILSPKKIQSDSEIKCENISGISGFDDDAEWIKTIIIINFFNDYFTSYDGSVSIEKIVDTVKRLCHFGSYGYSVEDEKESSK